MNNQKYNVYQYHHIDFSAGIDPKSKRLAEYELAKELTNVKIAFLLAGWQGDGKIEVLWIPPFVECGACEDTHGSFLWHVKQRNNGTSFIATKNKLAFNRLGLPQVNADEIKPYINF